MNTPPQVAIWLDVPAGCEMTARFTGDLDIQVTFGDRRDGQNLTFDRSALRQLADLASEILAVEPPDDPNADLPVVARP
ncbi:MAG: hypothetical protein ABW215_03060 [Kibdelosporangium sp.]